MPRLSATAPLNGVRVRYVDDKGKAHRQDVDGHLWIEQHFDTQPPSADVALFGTVLQQTVLDAGKNATDWWCILSGDGKQAWTGKVKTGEDVSANGVILRADKVLDVLAITLIEPREGVMVTMHPTDDDTGNVLLYTRQTGEGRGYIERELTVDRATGLPTDVRLFSEEGELVVRARLDTYRPVDYQDRKAAPAGERPEMPHHVIVEYPAADSSIELNFNEVSVPERILPRTFRTRDWEDLDIKPTVVE
jgi:hypothetical protein